MTQTIRGLAAGFAVIALAAAAPFAGRAQTPAPPQTAAQAQADLQYQNAKAQFDNLDYENAVRALDVAIAALSVVSPMDAATREKLASAYEMRARSKFGLGNPEEARADFVLLLRDQCQLPAHRSGLAARGHPLRGNRRPDRDDAERCRPPRDRTDHG